MLTPLTPALQSKYGVSIAAVTLLSSVYSLTSSVLQPLLGIVGERLDRRYAAALGPLMTGLGLTLMGFVPWFGALVLLVAVAGFGSGFFHPAIRSGKQRSSTSSMIGTAVDAPGDAPRRPAMLPSAAATTSVPNCSTPPFSASFFMTWTRWPAVTGSRSRTWPS